MPESKLDKQDRMVQISNILKYREFSLRNLKCFMKIIHLKIPMR